MDSVVDIKYIDPKGEIEFSLFCVDNRLPGKIIFVTSGVEKLMNELGRETTRLDSIDAFRIASMYYSSGCYITSEINKHQYCVFLRAGFSVFILDELSHLYDFGMFCTFEEAKLLQYTRISQIQGKADLSRTYFVQSAISYIFNYSAANLLQFLDVGRVEFRGSESETVVRFVDSPDYTFDVSFTGREVEVEDDQYDLFTSYPNNYRNAVGATINRGFNATMDWKPSNIEELRRVRIDGLFVYPDDIPHMTLRMNYSVLVPIYMINSAYAYGFRNLYVYGSSIDSYIRYYSFEFLFGDDIKYYYVLKSRSAVETVLESQDRRMLVENYISDGGIYEPFSDGFVISGFAPSNIQNLGMFQKVLDGSVILADGIYTFPSSEFSGVYYKYGMELGIGNRYEFDIDSGRPFLITSVRRREFKDFCINNMEAMRLGYFMPLVDFYVLSCGFTNKFFNADIDIDNPSMHAWGVLLVGERFSNLFNNQLSYSSATLLNRSWSEAARLYLRRGTAILYESRFHILNMLIPGRIRKIEGEESKFELLDRVHDPDPLYSYSYVSRTVDPSGHMINFLLFGCSQIINLQGYVRHIASNLNHQKRPASPGTEIGNFEADEDLDKLNELWHTGTDYRLAILIVEAIRDKWGGFVSYLPIMDYLRLSDSRSCNYKRPTEESRPPLFGRISRSQSGILCTVREFEKELNNQVESTDLPEYLVSEAFLEEYKAIRRLDGPVLSDTTKPDPCGNRRHSRKKDIRRKRRERYYVARRNNPNKST
jgi:hypothetical protein